MALQGENSRYKNQTAYDTRVNTDHPLFAFFKKVRSGENSATWYFVLIGFGFLAFLLPHITIIFVLLSLISLVAFFDRENIVQQMPMRLPVHATSPDGSMATAINRRRTSNNKDKFKATGTTYMGVDTETKEQVWFSDDDLLTHVMILGTTKSGKTYLILQLMLQAMIKNSGFFFVDGKGDIVTLKYICQIVRRFGRDADLTILSFLPYEQGTYGDETKPTNSLNIMRTATPTMISEVMVSLLDGQDDMWKGRTISFITALMPAMCVARDLGIIDLSANQILLYTEMRELEKFCWDTCQKSQSARLREASKAIADYLLNLPSYDKNKSNSEYGAPNSTQDSTTKDQHGFVAMQLLRALNDLSYNYGHIFGKESSDLDVQDAVFNRRNVVVSLPALGRSPSTLAMLGRIIISAIKQMASLALGSKVEGSIRLNVDARPTNARNVYGLLFDEVGYYIVSGIAIIPAQVRAFNIYSVFAGQTYSNIKKADANEAEEIWNNTNIKLVGRYVGGAEGEDFKKVQGLGGKAWVWRARNMTRDVGDFNTTYNKANNVEAYEEDRINLSDLATQQDGQFVAIMAKKSSLNNKDGEIAISYMQSMNPIPEGSTGFVFINSFVYIPKKPIKEIGTSDERAPMLDDLFKQGLHSQLNAYYFNQKDKLDNTQNVKDKLTDNIAILSNHFENSKATHHITDKVFLVHKFYSNTLQDERLGMNAPRQLLKDGQDLIGNDLFFKNQRSTEQVIEQSLQNIIEMREFKEATLDLSFDGSNEVSVSNARMSLPQHEQHLLETLPITEISIDEVIDDSLKQSVKEVTNMANEKLENIGKAHNINPVFFEHGDAF